MKRLVFIGIMLLVQCAAAHLSTAQVLELPEDVYPKSEYNVYFHFNQTDLDVYYHDNARTLTNLYQFVEKMTKVDSVCVYAYASPDGGSIRNDELAGQRAAAVREYLTLYLPALPQMADCAIMSYAMSENWDGLIDVVVRKYRRQDKAKVLSTLANEYITDETKKYRLGLLDGGSSWGYIKDNYMPEVTSARICVFGQTLEDQAYASSQPRYVRETVPVYGGMFGASGDTVSVAVAAPSQAPSPRAKVKSRTQVKAPSKTKVQKPVRTTVLTNLPQRTAVAFKTNLLFDAVTALNFAVEAPINKHFSVEYFQTLPWWRGKNNKFCMQFASFGGEARWWFLPRVLPATDKLKQRDALLGHFLGVYAWGGFGDIQLGRKVCHQFNFWSTGLTYGYSLPVSKHLNMEFTLSVGYAHIPYQHYIPTNDFSLLIKDHNLAGTLHYFGPTKAEVNLVIPIRSNTGRKAAKKGGQR